MKEEEVNQVYTVMYHDYKALCAHCSGLVCAKLLRSEEVSHKYGVKMVMNHLYYEVRCSYPECVRFKHIYSECSNCANCSGCHKR